jgi:hypothetical protein
MDNEPMVRPPHIEKIMKLLVLSGKGNSNAHEREVARDKAETLMARHGVTREQMRELYRLEHGLPARPAASAPARRRGEEAGFRPGNPRAGEEAPGVDPVELERLRREACARETAAQEQAAKARLARAQAERERAARAREEQERLVVGLRAAISQALGAHGDFADFIDHLASLGIQMAVPAEGAVERMVYRWPPSKVAIQAQSLGAGYDWPSLIQAGIPFNRKDERHRQALAMMFMG